MEARLKALHAALDARDDAAALAAIDALPEEELEMRYYGFGYTSLAYAALHGSEAAVNALLLRNASVDAVDGYGWTALIWASENGHVACVRRLLAANAAVDKANGGPADQVQDQRY